MYLYEVSAMVIYFMILLLVAFLSYRRHLSAADFIIGGRSMSALLTALAAHASDMSNWLFMAYPAGFLIMGVKNAWIGIGLIVCMYLNWQFVAPKMRVATEQYNSMTFSSFFESRLADTSGLIRLFSALILIVFYTIYISAGLTGLGSLLETLFELKYATGIIIGLLIVIPYVFTGGYRTLAFIDLFQGCFLLVVIILVPLFILTKVGGFSGISKALDVQGLTRSLLPDYSGATFLFIFSQIAGWGIGYFGQPHIVTKFMGIKNVAEIPKAKWLGMSWMVLSLGAASLVGLVGVAFFNGVGLYNNEQVFIEMVKRTFHPFILGIVLCAVLAAMINAMSSMVLVLSSSLTEDFYKRFFRKDASSKELLLVSRAGVILVAAVAFCIAFTRANTIQELVHYAWQGIGSAFGPLVILSLYSKRINKFGAWAGILFGGVISAVWPLFHINLPAMLPGFLCGIFAILFVSHLARHKVAEVV